MLGVSGTRGDTDRYTLPKYRLNLYAFAAATGCWTCIGFDPIRFPVQFGFIWFISHICLAFPYCKAMPGKPNWGLLRKYFNGNLKFIRLLARQRYCGALGPISAQTDFIFIHLRDFQRQFSEYGDNDDDAHAPISARNSRTLFGGSLGTSGGRIGLQRLGTVDWGAVAALW